MFRVASRDTGAALSRRVAPGSLPAGTPANSAYYPCVVQLIQAIEAITDVDDDPAWAIVNPVLWSPAHLHAEGAAARVHLAPGRRGYR